MLVVKKMQFLDKFRESKFCKFLQKCWTALKRYMENSSIHGIPFIVEAGRHWTEILFWLVACAISWYLCGTTVVETVVDFMTRKTAVSMDTNYLNWDIKFPALHFCFTFSINAKLYFINVTKLPIQKARTMNRLGAWSKLGYDSSITADVSEHEYRKYRDMLVPECKDMFGVCEWNGEPFDCCKIFFPFHSNLGGCISFNSIYAGLPTDPNLPKFTMTHFQPLARLTLFLNLSSPFFKESKGYCRALLTDPLQFPTYHLSIKDFLSIQFSNPIARLMAVQQIPTYNDDGVISGTIDDRKCRLAKETDGLLFLKSYNYYGCLMEAQMKVFNDTCGCVGHIYPATSVFRTCNQTELRCLDVPGVREKILAADNQDCIQDCEQTTVVPYDLDFTVNRSHPDWAFPRLEFNMLPGPYIKYNRYTVLSLLDVVVTVGGTLGLFVGASVLSIVEIPYWLFLRRNDD